MPDELLGLGSLGLDLDDLATFIASGNRTYAVQISGFRNDCAFSRRAYLKLLMSATAA
jgi:hypothetical protein